MAYVQHHKLAAVLHASLNVYQMTFDSSCTNRMGGDDDFGDVAVTYSCNVTKMAVFLRSKKHQLYRRSKFLLISVLSVFMGPTYDKFTKFAWGKGYNQVFLYCMHVYQQFVLLEGQKNRFFPYNFRYVGYNLLPK